MRDRVPLYANGWLTGNRPTAHGPAGEKDRYAECARAVVEQGYRCLKLYPFGGAQVITPERIARGVGLVAPHVTFRPQNTGKGTRPIWPDPFTGAGYNE